MPPKRKPKADRHEERLTVPLTAEQREWVREQARKEGLPDALWARRILLSVRASHVKEP